MTDKQIIKKLAKRYKEMCESPFADGYTFKAFEGRCAEQGFTIDDVRNYIEKEKQEQKAEQDESIESLKEQLKRKEQECEELKEKVKELRQGWINCDKERNLQEANSEFNQRVINRYKQALIEIKEIAENMNKECFYNDFDCEDCDMKNGCTYFNKKQILQKIKEAVK